MSTYNNFKPFPFVVGGGKKVGGIGLSGPGGLLWPDFPAVSNSMLKRKSGSGIPSPFFIANIRFSGDMLECDGLSEYDLYYTFIPNMQRILTSGSFNGAFGDFADVYTSYEGAEIFPPDTSEEDIINSMPANARMVTNVVFAYDGSPTGNSVLDIIMSETAPLDIILTVGGAASNYIGTDARITTVSFRKLIMTLTYDGGGQTNFFNDVDVSWSFDFEVDSSQWGVSVSTEEVKSPAPGGSMSVGSLNIRVKGIQAVDHPEQVGYASFYWGGLTASMGQSICINAFSSDPDGDPCYGVLGPCWLPHTTFYPLVEIGKTMPGDRPQSILDVPEDGDLTYLGSASGFGTFVRSVGSAYPETMVPNLGGLLNLPKKKYERGYYSFQPDYVDTRIINDPCIYPIVGPDDREQIAAFRSLHRRKTKTFYISG
jgi:hypothetical protein